MNWDIWKKTHERHSINCRQPPDNSSGLFIYSYYRSKSKYYKGDWTNRTRIVNSHDISKSNGGKIITVVNLWPIIYSSGPALNPNFQTIALRLMLPLQVMGKQFLYVTQMTPRIEVLGKYSVNSLQHDRWSPKKCHPENIGVTNLSAVTCPKPNHFLTCRIQPGRKLLN